MKMRSAAVFCLSLTAVSLRAEDVVFHVGGTMPGLISYSVPQREWEKIPPWSPLDGRKVPLSRDQAVAIAERAVVERGLPASPKPELTVSLQKLNPYEAISKQLLHLNACEWFYVVSLHQPNAADAVANQYSFAISMSGALATASPVERR